MLRLLLVFVLIPMALVGCGKSNKDKADDGNQKISRMNDINNAALKEYGIVLASNSTASSSTVNSINTSSLDQLTKAELQALQPLVQEFRNLAGEVLSILDDGGVTYAGDRGTLERAARNADNVLKAIATRLAKAA